MSTTQHLFVTKLYRTLLRGKAIDRLNSELARAAHVFAEDDTAGRAWSAQKYPGGYTSYASLNDLAWRSPEFADLQVHLDKHAVKFSEDLDFDLGGGQLVLDSFWVNILEPGGSHAGHIHPHSVLSGTYYVDVPKGAGAIRFEDPRHGLMMATPPRSAKASAENQTFVTVSPRAGMLLMWESWLRHEVPINDGDTPRISVSFNYAWNDA